MAPDARNEMNVTYNASLLQDDHEEGYIRPFGMRSEESPYMVYSRMSANSAQPLIRENHLPPKEGGAVACKLPRYKNLETAAQQKSHPQFSTAQPNSVALPETDTIAKNEGIYDLLDEEVKVCVTDGQKGSKEVGAGFQAVADVPTENSYSAREFGHRMRRIEERNECGGMSIDTDSLEDLCVGKGAAGEREGTAVVFEPGNTEFLSSPYEHHPRE